jgi:ribosomal protein L29
MSKQKKSVEALRGLGVSELKDKLISARKALFDLRIKKSELKNLLQLKWARREIARIMTLVKEKEASATAKTSK